MEPACGPGPALVARPGPRLVPRPGAETLSPRRTANGEASGDQSFFSVVSAMTAAEVARAFALHPNVARHHLDKLAAGGYLDVTIDHASPGAGRPSKRYRGSARSSAVPMPPRPDELVVALLVRALDLIEPAAAEAMAEEVGTEYGRSLASQMAPGDSQRSLRSALHAVADALTAHGFAAHAEAQGSSTSIIRDTCPFGELAHQHPVLCAVDRGMVEGLLGGLCGETLDIPVSMSSRALGDDSCATVTGATTPGATAPGATTPGATAPGATRTGVAS